MKIRLRRKPRSSEQMAGGESTSSATERTCWYLPKKINHCPCCGQSQWMIGRTLAECGHCSTALPIAR